MTVRPGSDHQGALRRLVWMLLGAAILIDAMLTPARGGQWVAGLVLVGIIPVDELLGRLRRNHERTDL